MASSFTLEFATTIHLVIPTTRHQLPGTTFDYHFSTWEQGAWQPAPTLVRQYDVSHAGDVVFLFTRPCAGRLVLSIRQPYSEEAGMSPTPPRRYVEWFAPTHTVSIPGARHALGTADVTVTVLVRDSRPGTGGVAPYFLAWTYWIDPHSFDVQVHLMTNRHEVAVIVARAEAVPRVS